MYHYNSCIVVTRLPINGEIKFSNVYHLLYDQDKKLLKIEYNRVLEKIWPHLLRPSWHPRVLYPGDILNSLLVTNQQQESLEFTVVQLISTSVNYANSIVGCFTSLFRVSYIMDYIYPSSRTYHKSLAAR
jgi:hypothetical protein